MSSLGGIVLAGGFLFATGVRAQEHGPERGPRPVPGGGTGDVYERIYRLERRVVDLESNHSRDLRALQDRVWELEQRIRNPNPNPPPHWPSQRFVCRIRDSYSQGSHLGSGSSELMAKVEAQKTCERVNSAVFCSTQRAECEQEVFGQKFYCALTDNYSRGVHQGYGTTLVESKHNAQKACEKVNSATFCTGLPQCENASRYPR